MTSDKPKGKLPEGVLEHKTFDPPQQFGDVTWRDFAELRERVQSLETYRNVAFFIIGSVSALVLTVLKIIWDKLPQ